MTTTKVKASTKSNKVPAGTLLSAHMTFAGNGDGVTVSFEYAPEDKSKGDLCYPGWQPTQPNIYDGIDSAMKAIKAERASSGGVMKK